MARFGIASEVALRLCTRLRRDLSAEREVGTLLLGIKRSWPEWDQAGVVMISFNLGSACLGRPSQRNVKYAG